jgi:hypothetical protein
VFLNFVSCERRSKEDSSIAFAIVEIDGDNEFLLPQILNISEVGTAPIRKGVPSPVGPPAPAANAIRIRKRQQQPCSGGALSSNATRPYKATRHSAARPGSGLRPRSARRTYNATHRDTARSSGPPPVCVTTNNPPRLLHQLLSSPPRPLQPHPINPLRKPLPANQLEPAPNIRIPGSPKQITLRQQRSQVRSKWQTPKVGCPKQHMRKPRMHTQPRHLPPVRSNAAGSVQAAESRQQVASARQHCRGRRVQPPQLRGVASAPTGKLQC